MNTKAIIVMLAAFIAALFLLQGWGPTLPSPGEELKKCFTNATCGPNEVCEKNTCSGPYPRAGECWGLQVTEWGKPRYDLDPNMQHMARLGCAVVNQCRTWPPESVPAGVSTGCCPNTGLCYSDEVK